VKRAFIVSIIGLAIFVVGCASTLERGHKLAELGNYDEAIELYNQVDFGRDGKADFDSAQYEIGLCYFHLGQIEFNAQNWAKAARLYKMADTKEASAKISSCNFELGQIELGHGNWKNAISLFTESDLWKAKRGLRSAKASLDSNYVARAKGAMAGGQFAEAAKLWNRLDQSGKAYATNRINIEKNLIEFATEKLQLNQFSAAIDLLDGKALTTSKYSRQALKLLAKAKQGRELEQLQARFEEKRASLNQRYTAANAIGKSIVFTEAAQWTANFISEHPVFKNWIGVITSLSTSRGGGTASVVIESKLSNVPVEYHARVESHDEALYSQLAHLPLRSTVKFSWKPSPGKEKGIQERSLTKAGAMYNPEFVGQLTNIHLAEHKKLAASQRNVRSDDATDLKRKRKQRAKTERLRRDFKDWLLENTAVTDVAFGDMQSITSFFVTLSPNKYTTRDNVTAIAKQLAKFCTMQIGVSFCSCHVFLGEEEYAVGRYSRR
jgi:tetratricopeptide (TPR) repeat protein